MERAGRTHTQPGGFAEKENKKDDGVINDSLSTADPADSTGTDSDSETGDTKGQNRNTRED